MNVFYSCSDAMAPYMGISMLSLFDNNQDIDKIDVYICSDNISFKNKNNINIIAKKYKQNVYYVECKDILEKKCQDIGLPRFRDSYATYAKIFIHDLFPECTGKILFLDASDTIVNGSLKYIDQIDMSKYVIGACIAYGYYVSNEKTFDNNLASQRHYYNMGVGILNIDNWIKYNCNNLIVEGLKSYPHYETADQTIINNYLPEKYFLSLPLEYNYTGYTRERIDAFDTIYKSGFYNKKEIKYAEISPIIIHWPGSFNHPYLKGSLCRNKGIYFKYKKMSPWRNYIEKERLTKELMFSDDVTHKTLRYYLYIILFYIPGSRKFISSIFNILFRKEVNK